MQMPHIAPGVPNPYIVHRHPYPTRYHGTINTRPVFGLPYVGRPQGVFRPVNFYSAWPPGPVTPQMPQSGLGQSWDVGDGVFRYPEADGGGIFNRALAGGCSACGQTSDTTKLVAFFGAAVVVGVGTYLVLRRKGGRK